MIKGFLMSLGMFSIIPVPRNSWNEKYMPLVIPALPVVGLLIGLLWYGAARLLFRLDVPPFMTSAFLLLIPFVISGLIHVDGFMDTADAVLSRRPLEDKKRILKDPNAGAFSVVAIIVIMLLQLSAVHTLVEAWRPINCLLAMISLIAIPIVSRCTAGAALILCKPIFETGYNVSFREGAKRRHLVFICALGLIGSVLAPWALLSGILMAVYLYRQFKGMSGDLCGCIIVASECIALIAMALGLNFIP